MARLRELYARWPFFRVLLQNAEVGLARTDAADRGALPGPGRRRRQRGWRRRSAQERDRTVGALLRITGRAALLDGLPALQRSIELRGPYLDPLDELQVQALGRLRRGNTADGDRAALEALVGLTISGIAAGVQGTG